MLAHAKPQADPAVRRSGIGSTDAAPICGVPMFGRDISRVYLEKLGLTAPFVATQRTDLGDWLEEPVARYWSRETGLPVRRRTATIRHAEAHHLFTHVDRLVTAGPTPLERVEALLEVKVANSFRASDFGEEGTDEVPPGYLLQSMHSMLVMPQVRVVYLAVLLGGTKFAKYEIPRDEALISDMREREEWFWRECVVPHVPPPLDGTEGAGDVLAQRFPADDGTTIDADEDLIRFVDEYRSADAAMERAKEAKSLAQQRIQERMGTATLVAGPDFRVSWKLAKGSVSWKAVAEHLRRYSKTADRMFDDIAEARRGDGSRRFVVTDKPGGQP